MLFSTKCLVEQLCLAYMPCGIVTNPTGHGCNLAENSTTVRAPKALTTDNQISLGLRTIWQTKLRFRKNLFCRKFCWDSKVFPDFNFVLPTQCIEHLNGHNQLQNSSCTFSITPVSFAATWYIWTCYVLSYNGFIWFHTPPMQTSPREPGRLILNTILSEL